MTHPHILTPEQVFTELSSRPAGLTEEEARERLLKYGKNALKEGKKRSLLAKFFDQLKDVMIIVLLVASAVSAAIAIIEQKYNELIDAGLILLIVIVNAVIGLVQENKAEASLETLKSLNKPFAKVLRGGLIEKIKSEDIVVGDVIVLEAGDVVPADLRLFEEKSLKVEEAALTGESAPVEKCVDALADPLAPLGDRCDMCYGSGIVSYGRGKGIVVATGMDTEVGKIAKMLQEDVKEETPLQVELGKTAKTLSLIVLVIAVVIFAAALIRGLTGGGDAAEIVIYSFMTAVAIAVAAIPEGLPAVVTIVLAVGVRRMSERNAIIRNLPAVEALGCCEVICSDKTGTLTLNQMTVQELFTPEDGLYKAGEEKGSGYSSKILVRGMALCNDTLRVGDKLVGDPTETALVAYADTLGFSDTYNNYPRVDELPFDSVRKLMTTVNNTPEGNVAHIKGAPDILLAKCAHILVGEEIRAITPEDRENIASANRAMASKALRVLGVAIKSDVKNKKKLEEDLTFAGLVGMIDPPRPEVKAAVDECKKAGMTAIMITGDHIETAKAIARDIGILEEGMGYLTLTGAELDKLSEADFMRDIDLYRVFARVSPENKLRIVKALKASGKKVAMTGDGANDAPSIKAADIGVGMGITGTDVSKGAADMVLADDNFATIVHAVEEGRKVYSNIKKAVKYLLSANIAEVLCLFITTVFLNLPFLTPVMILWVNLVTDALPALALGMEKAEKDIMSYPPRKSDKSLLSGKTGKDILLQGVFQTVLVLASFLIGHLAFHNGTLNGEADKSAMTMAFVTLCMIQLFHAYNTRSERHSLFATNPFDNKFMNMSFLVCAAMIILVVAVPGIGSSLFETGSLTAREWLVALGSALLVIPFVEAQKLIENAYDRFKKRKNL
jgi:plasma-membrane calcium-translocating P-type ATPase